MWNWGKLTDEEKVAIAAESYADPVLFARNFFPDVFTEELPWFHRGILAIFTRKTDFLAKYGDLDKIAKHFTWRENPEDAKSKEHSLFSIVDVDGVQKIHLIATQYVELILPRGCSKTTIGGLLSTLYGVYYNEFKFLLYISETAPHSERQLQNIQAEIESNDRLREVFGTLKPSHSSPLKWTAGLCETTNGVTLMAKGRGTQVRGSLIKNQRPDRIIFDDIEDEESVLTPEQRDKALTWLLQAVKPALAKHDSFMIGLGTMLHRESILASLSRDPQWTTIWFGAIDKDGDALWPYWMSLKDLEREKRSYQLQGKLNAFYMEYMSELRNEETAIFKSSFIIYQPTTPADCVARALAIDPAISEKVGSDGTSLAAVGITEKGELPIFDVFWQVGVKPREQVDMYFEWSARWDITLHGVESIAFQAALVHLLREEMYRKGRYFEIVPITHSTKKDERIKGILQPRYAAGYIKHNRRFPDYESQLLDFPAGKKDAPDAVAMAVSLLDPYAAAAADPEKDLADDTMPPLEEVFDGEWQTY